MCGIFCLKVAPDSAVEFATVRETIAALLRLAERRGREASGVAALFPTGSFLVKQPTSASALLRSKSFDQFMDAVARDGFENGKAKAPMAFIGHARLVTNGKRVLHANNQPFRLDRIVGVHNGIVVNAEELFRRGNPNTPPPELDSLSIAHAMLRHCAGGADLAEANRRALADMEGIATYLAFDTQESAVLAATNNGSLYAADAPGVGLVLVSENQMLTELSAAPSVVKIDLATARQLAPGTAGTWFLTGSPAEARSSANGSGLPSAPAVTDLSALRDPADARLQRCTKCLLPSTMPFIAFDAEGVCNWCSEERLTPLRPMPELEAKLAPVRRSDRHDCLMAVSGGRDSCYGLHIAKKVLGLNPVAFTYDWGMVTDIARRNTSRVCAKLGIEHILVSADIDRKRENIRKNVEAWLRKPDLGTVPLFTAGDKQFYYHANRLKRELGVDLIVFCENGRFEKTWFKAGFCGVNEGSRRLWNISLAEKLQLAAYYGRAFVRNPKFINTSLVDTFGAYLASYFLEHDYVQLFDYVPWEEREVERTLREQYGWELAPDAPTSWRIGDGTAPFYNFIYYTAAGFTEFDTFRSNQIRAGHLDRATALALVQRENVPRLDAIKDYTNLVGVNFDKAVRAIQAMPRLYN